MSKTTNNRRKKLNRQGDGRCRQCGSVKPTPDETGFVGWFSCKELTDEYYRIHRNDDHSPIFCGQRCVDKWRTQHELFIKGAVNYYSVIRGGVAKGIGVSAWNGEVVEDNIPCRPVAFWVLSGN